MTLVDFRLKTPFGGWLVLAWAPPTACGVTPGEAWQYVDYLDESCGDNPGFQALVPAAAESDWRVVGTVNGRDIAFPTKTNPYAKERYAAYVVIKGGTSLASDPMPDFDDFLAAPGLVALRADEGGWWVQLDSELSPRAWC